MDQKMRIRINDRYKSLRPSNHFTLPPFTVLTGQNGSGKTHLLEAISKLAAEVTSENGARITQITYIPYNGLNPHIDEACNPLQLIQRADDLWQRIMPMTISYKAQNFSIDGPDIIERFVNIQYGTDAVRNSVLRNIIISSGKSLGEVTSDDVYQYMTFNQAATESIFTSQLAQVFKSYQIKWTNNKFNKYLANIEGVIGAKYLEDTDFEVAHGIAPWILVNGILAKAGLPYQFQEPTPSEKDLTYYLKLSDKHSGETISVNELSTGEKVLLSIALATYNTNSAGARPELLLLDEPDAPLHPTYSSILLAVLKDVIVEQAGVNVIMTTHSPSTVAISPDNSIFEITRAEKIPLMISSSRAVSLLTAGIKYLRVSYEKRKTIFVESKYDVSYYESIFDSLGRLHNFSYQAIFMEPHAGSSNCTDVIQIVRKLRDAGNEQTWGIIDFDGKNRESDYVMVLGDKNRYSIENYLLDPLYIALALIRCGKKKFSDFRISTCQTYPDAMNLTQAECQVIIDSVLDELGLASTDLSVTRLENGYSVSYPRAFLLLNGHEYERQLTTRYPELNAISRGQGDAALKTRLAEVVAEFPKFLPVELGKLFARLNE